MAGKSRRVASRQGELSRRRKRTQRGPSGIPAVRPPAGAATAAATAEPVAVGAAAGAAASASAPVAASTTASQAAAGGRPGVGGAAQARGPGRPRGERPAAYNYVGAELRRIGILSVVALGALIGLAFVL